MDAIALRDQDATEIPEVERLRFKLAEFERRAAEADRLRSRLSLLSRASWALHQTLDVEATLGAALDDLAGAFGADTVVVNLLAPDGALERRIGRWFSDEHQAAMAGREGGVTRLVWRTREPVVIRDVSRRPDIVLPAHPALGVRSLAAFPIADQQGMVRGVLLLYYRRRQGFSDAEVRLLGAYAEHVGVALANARLYAESEQRRQLAQAVAEMGRLLGRSLEPDAVAQQVVESLRLWAPAGAARLFRLDPETGALEPVAATGPQAAERLVLPPGAGAVGLTVREGQPVTTPDVLADARVTYPAEVRARLQAWPQRAVLALPLRARGHVVGALAIADATGRVFGEDEITMACVFADQAALALENARLYREVAQQREQLQELFNTARRAAASSSLADLLPTLVRSAPALLGAEAGTIRLIDGTGARLEVVAHHGLGDSLAQRGPLQVGEGPMGRVAVDGRPVVVEDLAASDRYVHRELARAEGLRSMVVVPLRTGARIIGILTVLSRTPRRYRPPEIDLLGEFANLAAISIDNARRYEEAHAHGARLRRLAELTDLVSSSLDLPHVLTFVTDAALDLLDVDLVQLWVADEAEQALRLAATAGRGGAVPDGARASVAPGEGVIGWVVAHQAPRCSPDLVAEPLETDRAWVRRHGYVTQLAVPLAVGGRTLGALAVLTRRPHDFDAREQELLGMFATKAAQALEHARLFKRTHGDLLAAQQQLLHAQKMEAVGRLAGGIAHDFNNLLTVIMGLVQLAMRESPDADDAERRGQQLEMILDTAGRAAMLTRQLLALSRKQVLQRRRLDLNQVVLGLGTMLRRVIGEDIELVLRPGEGLPPVMGDQSLLEQVLMNLVVNARDAMPRGGMLAIGTATVVLDGAAARCREGCAPGPYAALTVRDTGVGMDEAVRSRAFEPFFTTKPEGKGTGLGLALAYGIVRQHGGAIELESVPGLGTTFTILLPAAPAAEDRVAAASAAELPRGDETILVVEDEETVRHMAGEVLRLAGYTVLEAADADTALGLSEMYPGSIHLLLTDVVMPRMSGVKLAARLASLRPDTRVLYMSGYTDELLGSHGALEPGTALLQKPFTMAGLAQRVRECLDAARG